MLRSIERSPAGAGGARIVILSIQPRRVSTNAEPCAGRISALRLGSSPCAGRVRCFALAQLRALRKLRVMGGRRSTQIVRGSARIRRSDRPRTARLPPTPPKSISIGNGFGTRRVHGAFTRPERSARIRVRSALICVSRGHGAVPARGDEPTRSTKPSQRAETSQGAVRHGAARSTETSGREETES